jgi:hypothetical protein
MEMDCRVKPAMTAADFARRVAAAQKGKAK